MESTHKALLLDNRMELKDHIYYRILDVTNYLMSKKVITPNMAHAVLDEGGNVDKTYRLLDMLPLRGCRAFSIFYDGVCYCNLWGAADILEPSNAPHEQNVAGRNIDGPPNVGPNLVQGGAGIQVNLALVLNSMGQYQRELYQEWKPNHLHNGNSYSHHAHQQCEGYAYQCPPNGKQYQNQQLFCIDGLTQQMKHQKLCDSPKAALTKCQDLISEFKVPLNINDYITLAALERKADLEEKKAHDIITCMATRAKEYFEAKLSELTDSRMTPEKAIRQYISMSQPQTSYTDFKFFQVWGLSHPLVGLNILAVNSQKIMFLDFATKKHKDNLQWPMESLNECRQSNDYIYSTILKFQDQTILTLLSLEFEEICRELETLMDQSISRFGI